MTNRHLRAKLVNQFVPKGATVVEVGVFRGDFSFELLEIISPEKLHLIDPWKNLDDPTLSDSWYHVESKHDMDAIHASVCHRFASEIETGQVEIQRGKTQDVLPGLPDTSLDFAYVDGDHRFEGVLLDLDLLAPKMKPGATIMLDDYVLGRWWGDGVVRALNVFLGKQAHGWIIIRAVGNQVVIKKRG